MPLLRIVFAFFWVLFIFPVNVSAQNENAAGPHLTAIPGLTISPLESRYILIRLQADAFMFSSTFTNVNIVVPYQYTETLARDTFYGSCTIPDRAIAPQMRTVLGCEFQVGKSPVVILDFSFSHEKTVFGRFNNLNYLKFGFAYNFGIMQEKSVSQFVIRPGLMLVYHEDNYLAGYVTDDKIRFAGYDFEGDGSGSLVVGYASMHNMLQANLGLWWLPHYGRRMNVAHWIVLPSLSFRFELGYSFPMWSKQRISIGESSTYTKIGNEGVTSDPTPEALKRAHDYYGLTFSFGIVFRPYRRH